MGQSWALVNWQHFRKSQSFCPHCLYVQKLSLNSLRVKCRVCYFWQKLFNLTDKKKSRSETKLCFCSGWSREGARPPLPHPYFKTKLRPEGPKKIFWRHPPPPYLRVFGWPGPPLSRGLDWALFCAIVALALSYREPDLQSSRMTFKSGPSFSNF